MADPGSSPLATQFRGGLHPPQGDAAGVQAGHGDSPREHGSRAGALLRTGAWDVNQVNLTFFYVLLKKQ